MATPTPKAATPTAAATIFEGFIGGNGCPWMSRCHGFQTPQGGDAGGGPALGALFASSSVADVYGRHGDVWLILIFMPPSTGLSLTTMRKPPPAPEKRQP